MFLVHPTITDKEISLTCEAIVQVLQKSIVSLIDQYDLIALRTENGVEKLLPGLTGWAQVNGRDELPIPQKVELDGEYMRRRSFLFDFKIVWLTFLKVIKRQDVSH